VYQLIADLIRERAEPLVLLAWRIFQCITQKTFRTERKKLRALYWVHTIKDLPRFPLSDPRRPRALEILRQFFAQGPENAFDFAGLVLSEIVALPEFTRPDIGSQAVVFRIGKLIGWSEPMKIQAVELIRSAEKLNRDDISAAIEYLELFDTFLEWWTIEAIVAKFLLGDREPTQVELHSVLNLVVNTIEHRQSEDRCQRFRDRVLTIAVVSWGETIERVTLHLGSVVGHFLKELIYRVNPDFGGWRDMPLMQQIMALMEKMNKKLTSEEGGDYGPLSELERNACTARFDFDVTPALRSILSRLENFQNPD
jgi:hypothetical protein